MLFSLLNFLVCILSKTQHSSPCNGIDKTHARQALLFVWKVRSLSREPTCTFHTKVVLYQHLYFQIDVSWNQHGKTHPWHTFLHQLLQLIPHTTAHHLPFSHMILQGQPHCRNRVIGHFQISEYKDFVQCFCDFFTNCQMGKIISLQLPPPLKPLCDSECSSSANCFQSFLKHL